MYGHIHVILKDLVLSAAGLGAWKRILVEAGCKDEEHMVLDSVPQGDLVTFGLVGATCKVLNLTLDKALHAFGRHFVQYALRSGNRAFLKSQGATFPEFLGNVNTLHNYLERDHPAARFPFLLTHFDPAIQTVYLSYLSTREGLKSLLVGVIEEIGLRLYGVDVMFEVDPEMPEELRHAAASNRAASWKVTWRARPNGPEPMPEQAEVQKVPFPLLHSAMTGAMELARRSSKGLSARCGRKPPNIRDSVTDMNATPSVALAKWRQVIGRDLADDLGSVLLRTTPAREVAAAWSDPTLPRVREFWSTPVGRAEDYELSCDDHKIDVFVSHSWGAPLDWEAVMGKDISYEDVKSTMVSLMAKDISMAKGDISQWGDVRMWVDKACIAQDVPELKEMCINLIDTFIQKSEHVCVIFTWSYLERLWCVYEWASILLDKDPRKVWMQNEVLVTEKTLPLYLACVRGFSLARAKCFAEGDRAILRAKIESCYVTEEAFETLVKATAIALMARSMAFRAGRSNLVRDIFFTPWVRLAEELGFPELAAALATCRALHWRTCDQQVTRLAHAQGRAEEAAPRSPKSVSTASPSIPLSPKSASSASSWTSEFERSDTCHSVAARRYHELINLWFEANVVPVLTDLRGAVEALKEFN